jgi:hypothetical protein
VNNPRAYHGYIGVYRVLLQVTVIPRLRAAQASLDVSYQRPSSIVSRVPIFGRGVVPYSYRLLCLTTSR